MAKYVSELDLPVAAPSPQTPEGVVVRTPLVEGPSSQIIRFDNLPWFRFQEFVDPRRKFLLHLRTCDQTIKRTLIPHIVLFGPNQRADNLVYALDGFHYIHSIEPTMELATSGHISDVRNIFAQMFLETSTIGRRNYESILYSRFQAMFWERREGELKQSVTNLLGPVAKGVLWELLSLAIYSLSNNHSSLYDDDRLLSWITDNSLETALKSLCLIKSSTVKASMAKLLWSALRVDNRPVLKILIQAGTCHAARNSNGETLLQAVCGRQFGYRPHEGFNNEELRAAANHSRLDLVRLLIDAGADVNAPASEGGKRTRGGWTTLQEAAGEGHLALVQLLLEAGADVNAPAGKNFGRTALQAAVENGDLPLVQLLLEAGADVNAPAGKGCGRTALQAAAEEGHLALVQLLLEAGADVDAPAGKEYGHTALQAAVENGDLALVQLLLEAGADVNAPASKEYGQTALQAAASRGDLALVQLLLEAGADVNAPAGKGYGRTALQAAAEEGHLALVQLLLEAGADVNAPAGEEYGRTALQAAASFGYVDIVQVLLKAGAHFDTPAAHGGATALQFAAIEGYIGIARIFLENGWDVNASCAVSNGRTALEGAAEHGRLDMVQLLLNVGADTNIVGEERYKSAIELARQNGHLAIVELLETY